MEFRERPIILTDIKTTGLDPRDHEILEIGAIKVDQKLEEIGRFEIKIYPTRLHVASPKALEINGYNEKDWSGAASRMEAASEFSDFAREGILCSWNITFEYGFLDQLFRLTMVPNQMDYHRIDIPSLVWAFLPTQPKLSMDYTREYMGLEPEPKPHRGIVGAECELEILRLLLFGGKKF